MIDFDIYKKIDNEWYNTKQSLLEKKDYIGAIKITEQYLEKLNGDYESKYSGKLAYMFLDSLINILTKYINNLKNNNNNIQKKL